VNNGHEDRATERAFYDDFLRCRMVEYRLNKNPRLEAIKETLSPLLSPGCRVLEVGCGIGVLTEFMARRARTVYALDLSPKNICYARHTVRASNISWREADVLTNLPGISDWLGGAVDVVLLADVLEHIPRDSHEALLAGLRGLLGQDSCMLITVPSPQYQRYLREHRPQELQPVDEIIEGTWFFELAAATGLTVRRYESRHVGGLRNQYVHCLLDAHVAVDPAPRPALPVW
jgi:cyclopropane fatty-acyl-phospholipid synthase-like methyltransferase